VTIVVTRSSPDTRHYCGHGRHGLPTPLWVICKDNPQQPSVFVFVLFLYKNTFKKKIKVHLLLLFLNEDKVYFFVFMQDKRGIVQIFYSFF
jgi:hypothetical protein